jgi:hypothetical protein
MAKFSWARAGEIAVGSAIAAVASAAVLEGTRRALAGTQEGNMGFGEHYKLTGMQSHRHPFYGDGLNGPGDIIDTDRPFYAHSALANDDTRLYEALAADDDSRLSVRKIARPLVEGITAGLAVYVISRAFGVAAKKAAQVSFVTGGLNLAAGLASDYLFREIEALKPVTGEPT